jgi:hypothetical protein
MGYRPSHDAGKTRCPTDPHAVVESNDSRLSGERTASAQKAEELKQRQPENCKIIALDLCKKLDPSLLEAITADRSKSRSLLGTEIGIEKRITEMPHGQLRRAYGMPHPSCLANNADRGYEHVGSAAQRLKLSTGIGEIARLVQPNFTAHQNLVGADNQRVSMVSRYLPSLSFRKRKRTVGCGSLFDLEDPFERFFVHQCRFDLHREAGGSE